MKVPWVLLALIGGLTSVVSAQPTFWLRNTDPSAEFVYWTVTLGRAGTAQAPDLVLASLPGAPGGARAVAPGERVKVVLGEDRSLVGAFLPWTEGPTYRTPLVGGFLLAGEVPPKGTLLVDRPGFAAANRGRTLTAPLQAWGLVPPARVLDGKTEDWTGVPPLVEWGPGFTAGWKAPVSWPRPASLRALVRDGVLWLWFAADRPWSSFPRGTSASLVLRRPGGWFEWPLTGPEGTVWSWVEGQATGVGFRVVRGGDLEAWIPLDRLSPGELQAWTTGGAWALLITDGTTVFPFDLGTLAGEDLR